MLMACFAKNMVIYTPPDYKISAARM